MLRRRIAVEARTWGLVARRVLESPQVASFVLNYVVMPRLVEPVVEEVAKRTASKIRDKVRPERWMYVKSEKVRPLPKITKTHLCRFVIKEHTPDHKTARAKGKKPRQAPKHWDVRVNVPGHGDVSFAVPACRMPGTKGILAVLQPQHDVETEYGFDGRYPEGKGEGRTKILHGKKEADWHCEVSPSPNALFKIRFFGKGIAGEYAVVKPKPVKGRPKPKPNDFMLVKVRRTRLEPVAKPDYRERKRGADGLPDIPDEVWASETHVAEEKMDGHHSHVRTGKGKTSNGRKLRGKVHVTSYRIAKIARAWGQPAGEVIDHTDRVPHIRDGLVGKIPDDTIVAGELYRPGATGAEVGGMLNSNPVSSQLEQRRTGRLRFRMFDVRRCAGKDLTNMTYGEKLKVMERLARASGGLLEAPKPVAGRAKRRLWKRILDKGRKDPSIEAGIVIKDVTKPVRYTNDPKKKNAEAPPWDKVKRGIVICKRVVGTYEATEGSQHDGKRIGGLQFDDGTEGSPVGRVGTGLSFEQRERWFNHPEEIVGKIIEVRGNEVSRAGVLVKPALVRLRPDATLADVDVYVPDRGIVKRKDLKQQGKAS